MRREILSSVVSASALLATVSSASPAVAAATYFYSESAGAINLTGGYLSDRIHNSNTIPITFSFTVANALAANTIYNFGFSGVENGESGNATNITFSNGSAASSFSSDNYHGHDGLARIGVTTDANANIALFDIFVSGPSTFLIDGLTRPSSIYIQLQHTDPQTTNVSQLESLSNPDARGGPLGDVVCRVGCGGGFIGVQNGNPPIAGALPEPATWAMMIMGFAATGISVRLRRQANNSRLQTMSA